MKHAFLIGRQIYLRPLQPDDAERFTRWMNDGRVTRTLQARRPITLAGEREWIERVTRSEHDLVCAIVRRRDDRHIGSTGLHFIDLQARAAAFGIVIGEPSMWGRGYGSEATRLIVDHAFQTVNLNRVWLEVHDGNPGARRAYEKAGFRLEGVQRQAVYREGRYSDLLLMAILREEWAASRPGGATAGARRGAVVERTVAAGARRGAAAGSGGRKREPANPRRSSGRRARRG